MISDSPENLVPMNIFASRWPLQTELVYSLPDHPSNHFGQIYHPGARLLWLHKDLAAVVLAAARILNEARGWKVILCDGLRPVEAQEKMRQKNVTTPDMLALPGQGAHPRGLAIDLVILDEKETKIDMGTEFDYFPPDPRADNPAARDYPDFGAPARTLAVWQNRAALEGAMRWAASRLAFPLWPLPHEWWDFRSEKAHFEKRRAFHESDLYPVQRLMEPDLSDQEAVLANKIPGWLEPALADVEKAASELSSRSPVQFFGHGGQVVLE